MAATIMHISDVHLGDDLVVRSLLRLRPWWQFVDQKVTDGLVAAIQNLKPDLIILSGDIVNKPKEKTFSVAATYLRKVFQKAGFDINKNLLVIPGNHDVSFFPRKHTDDLERLKLYREFLRRLFDETSIETRKQRFVWVEPKNKLIVVCLDSTLRDRFPLAEGQIGTNQLQWVRQKLTELARQLGSEYRDYVRIAVCHHHPVPIAGMSISSESFMPLLDAGDFLSILDELRFQIVMHGHKHFPRMDSRPRSDSSVLTIIGAGTATCKAVQEQQGQGNNFNWITISRETSTGCCQLYRADQNGSFAPASEPKCFPLTRFTPQGYSVKSITEISTLSADGNLHVRFIKQDIRVAEKHREIRELPFRLSTSSSTAKIRDFQPVTQYARLKPQIEQPTIIQGDWILSQPLTYNSHPITIGYTYTLEGGTAMSRKHFRDMYQTDAPPEESTTIIVTNPAENLQMEVNFPDRFAAAPFVRVEYLGAVVPLDKFQYSFEYHKAANRWVLDMQDPPIEHEISIVWPLPELWDLLVSDQ